MANKEESIFFAVEGDHILVASTYGMKGFWKEVPGRKWDPKTNSWKFPATQSAAYCVAEAARNIRQRYATHPDPAHQRTVKASACAEFRSLLDRFDAGRLPLGEDYDPPIPETWREGAHAPWHHQQVGVEFAKRNPGVLFDAGMGVGKSAMFVATAGDIDAKKVLIIAPKNPMGIWPKQFKQWSSLEWDCIVLNSRKSCHERAKEAKKFLDMAEYHGRRAVVIVNYDACWRGPSMDKFLLMTEWDIVGLDEVHRIKSNAGKASKFCAKLCNRVPKKIGMTGTPMAHSPLDLFGQFRALDPGVYGTSFGAFKHRYCQMGGYGGQEIIEFKNKADMKKRMDLITFHVDRDKVLDLPEEIMVPVEINLSKKTAELYKKMENDFYLKVDEGEITAKNCMTKLLKLAQIANGTVLDDERKATRVGEDKADWLKEFLQDAELPVVVACRFKSDLDDVMAVAMSLDLRYHEVSGRAHELNEDGTILPGTQVLGVQIQSGSEGTDFTAACVSVLYSIGFSRKDYEQFLKRLHRPGQTRPVTNYQLKAKDTVDYRIYYALKTGQDIVDCIMEGRGAPSQYDDLES